MALPLQGFQMLLVMELLSGSLTPIKLCLMWLCLRHNHYLLSIYCERKIAPETMTEKAFVLPDGTWQQGIGGIAGMVVKVVDKICALKSLKMSKVDRSNWATAIIHMLDCLATATKVKIEVIWKSITAMDSDLCKVNKQLVSEF